MDFYIVDAFSDKLFGGNPAGVVMVEGEWPADEVMAKTAAELRYSESAFVKKTGEGAFHTRYFAPTGEVDLCGHATIGTFHALTEAGLAKPGSLYKNQTRAGLLDIALEDGAIYMAMAAPTNPAGPKTAAEFEELYRVCGVPQADWPADLAPATAATGMADIILPVKDEAALAAMKPDFAAMAQLSKRYNVVGVHAFSPAGADGKVHCRNFAPLFGIDEEAATGTANGALTWYLYQNGRVKDGDETVFIQGEAMGRPSTIRSRLVRALLTADTSRSEVEPAAGEASAQHAGEPLCAAGDVNGEVKIKIGGGAVTLAHGEIFI